MPTMKAPETTSSTRMKCQYVPNSWGVRWSATTSSATLVSNPERSVTPKATAE